MTSTLTPHGPDANPPVPRWRYVAAALTVLLLVGGSLAWFMRPEPAGCAPHVKRFEEAGGAHCVGLTDDGSLFSENLKTVAGLIEEENRAVMRAAEKGTASYVSIVYLMGMKPGKGDSKNPESVRHELEGAYTAQYQANHHRQGGDTPKIRLLLGDTGNTDEQREYTMGRIDARLAEARIVAIAGLGTSLTDTEEMAARLASWKIASVGSVITADRLGAIRGLVRVAPPNADQAAAAVQFLRTPEYRSTKVLVVEDANKDDLYTKSLAASFGRTFPGNRLVHAQTMQYDSANKGQIATYFTNQMSNLCLAAPDVVYFAGRGRDLPDFLGPLTGRHCKHTRLTVISGDDTSQVLQADGFDDVKQSLRDGNIRLLYTGLAHPDAWELAPEFFDAAAVAPFREPDGIYRKSFNDKLVDGQAIMGHDAVRTAVKVIRMSYSDAKTSWEVKRGGVKDMLTALSGANAVEGAGGWISLRNNGSPERKAIPVIEIAAGGRTTAVDVLSGAGSGEPYRPAGQG
ncbi:MULTISPECIES: ABC transporter substrate-binding protein [unclassified Streptomyces]|uniref:ABC transporter substrate-binding protein n=1 Tax=unclassified Streptomyces TaxID=2593676 RepID=UPI00381D07A9